MFNIYNTTNNIQHTGTGTGTMTQVMDTQLAAQAYQYGRYLMFSAASHGVSNLQGLWADGPMSPWNGDYHLNINLQVIIDSK
jgi:hypothetical protein